MRRKMDVVGMTAIVFFVLAFPLFADTTTYTGNDITVTFTIPGGASIHKYTVNVDTNETGLDTSGLSYKLTHSGTSNNPSVTYNSDLSRDWLLADSGDDDTGGVNLNLTGVTDGDSTKIIRLVLTANPDAALKGTFSSTYTWSFTITDPGASSHSYTAATSATTGAGGTVNFPEIDIADSLVPLPDGSGTHGFGSILVDGDNGAASGYETFTIANSGLANLTVTGVGLSGADAGSFDLDLLTATNGALPWTISPSTSMSFKVRFDPLSSGAKSATVSVANNDSFESDYTFTVTGTGLAPAPEINLKHSGADIASGGSYGFGSMVNDGNGGSFAGPETFTIYNEGSANLTVSALAFTSATAHFDLDLLPATNGSLPWTIGVGASASFTVAFDPTSTGGLSAVLRVTNNDSDEGSYDITMSGTGTIAPAPEINLKHSSDNIASGGSYGFGSVYADGNGLVMGGPETFTIWNDGSADLSVTGIAFTTGSTADFDLTVPSPAPSALSPWTIASGGSKTFSVDFDPLTNGGKSVDLQISCNDSDESGYTATFTGTGAPVPAPEITVKHGLADIGSPGSYGFGSVYADGNGLVMGGPETFTIWNDGSADLSVTGIAFTTGSTADFDLTVPSPAPSALSPWTIIAGGSRTFSVDFDPLTNGGKSVDLQISCNDSDESGYTATFTGTGAPVPAPEITVKHGLADIGSPGSYGFGSVYTDGNGLVMGGPETFTIWNDGSADLSVTGIAFTTGSTADFDLTVPSPAPSALSPWTIASGGSRTFSVDFDPLTNGGKSVDLQISSNDSDESSYTATFSGTGTPVPAPELVVKHGADDIGSPGAYGFVDVLVDGADGHVAGPETFTILNDGSADLVVTSIVFQSGDTSDFKLVVPSPAPSVLSPWTIAAGSSKSFTVAFDPLTDGDKSVVVRISSNDTDESSYDATLSGFGIKPAPEIDVSDSIGPFTPTRQNHFISWILADGEDGIVSTPAETFTIANSGTKELRITSISLSAGDTDQFNLSVPSPAPSAASPWIIAVGATRTFTIAFDPLSPGGKGATVRILSDDADEAIFYFSVSGIGLPMDKMLFPPSMGLPWEGGPTIDGIVDKNPAGSNDEVGWNNAFRLTYEDGTAPQLAFQGLRDPSGAYSYLQMSFEVKNDKTFDDEDTIILCLRPNQSWVADPGKDLRIFIQPLRAGSGAYDPAGIASFESDAQKVKPNRPVRSMKFYQRQQDGAGAWHWIDITASIDASGFEARVYSYPEDPANPVTTTFAWNVELKMPTSISKGGSPWFSLAENFKFLFDVVKVDSTPGALQYAYQYVWPRRLPQEPYGDLESVYDWPFVYWGDTSINDTGQCKGVSISYEDIGVLIDPTPSTAADPTIAPGNLTTDFTLGTFDAAGVLTARAFNRVSVGVKNGSEAVSLNAATGKVEAHPVPAEGMRVRIRIAHWGATLGTSQDWRSLQGLHEDAAVVPPFPTKPADPFAWQTYTDANGWLPVKDIPAGTAAGPKTGYFFFDYVPSDTDIDYYKNTQDHQCIYVEVDSVKNADIITRSTWQNMNFVEASTYKDIARISAAGLPKPPAGGAEQRVILRESVKTWTAAKSGSKDAKEAKAAKKADRLALALASKPKVARPSTALEPYSPTDDVDSYMEYTVDASYETGEFVIIHGKKFYFYKPIGSFGYIAHHGGPVSKWKTELGKAKKIGEGLYELRIKAGGYVDIEPKITARSADWSLSFHGGTAVPLPSTSNSFGPGIAADLGIGHRLLGNLSIQATLGYAGLAGKSGTDDANWLYGSLGFGFVRAIRAPFLVNAKAGAGYYYELGGTGAFGANGGLGAEYLITRSLSIETCALYHRVFDSDKTSFMTAGAGLVFRF